jgi:hypothetical protein
MGGTSWEPPRFRVADIMRLHGAAWLREHVSTHQQRRAVDGIVACRSAALGAHRSLYSCGHEVIAYNSCRNRNCGRCLQGRAFDWVEQKQQDLIPVPYFHVVFTLPPALVDVPLVARAGLYEALFRAAAQTLLQFGRDRLKGQLGFLAVLHTWGQTLTHHPHIHFVVPGGAFDVEKQAWVPTKRRFLFPVRAMSKVFRGKMLHELRRRGLEGVTDDNLQRRLDDAAAVKWVVYAKPPFGGPQQVLRYLARYTHKIAIGDHRIVDVDDDTVAFRYKDYADGNAAKVMRLDAGVFVGRFLQHVLPRHFTRLRSFGFLANTKKRERLIAIRAALCASPPPPPTSTEAPCHCPRCGTGQLVARVRLAPFTLLPLDTS